MKLIRAKSSGYALLTVLFLSALSLMGVAGAMRWASTSSRLNDRNNRYFDAAYAAEAATEKVLGQMATDFQTYGEGTVYGRLDNYRGLVPTTSENTYWGNFSFSNAQGNSGTYVNRTVAWAYTELQSQYSGLRGMASTYRIVSNARIPNVKPPLYGAIRQDIQLATIPIFQFAIFYSMDLEINPGPNMDITGRVHSNANLYTEPQAVLRYLSDVTAVGTIKLHKSSLDPLVRNFGSVDFKAEHDAGAAALSLPIGTNNTPQAVRAVIEIPPTTESSSSLMGQQRYYNKADMLILVSNSNVIVKSGKWNNFGNSLPWTQVSSFINTNVNFYNKREGKTVKTTQIDVAKLVQFTTTNSFFTNGLGRQINSVYVADQRSQTGSTEAGVRLVNGETLPLNGLTVATPNPLYVQGNYNAPLAHRGTTNTTLTKPASLVADAITILSTSWNDANANSGIGSRAAGNTTVNAAFLSGIVPSNGAYYSGGVENFPRFLEDWGNDTFTYNGSMVVMFPSQTAIAPWGSSDVYVPPTRKWAFDLNFMDATKLPPGTPQLVTVIRAGWAMVAPNTTAQ